MSHLDLTDTERTILDIEALHWQVIGAKEQAIKDRLGMSPTRYYQKLNALLETERALAADPLLVNRLRRLRDHRQRVRPRRLAG